MNSIWKLESAKAELTRQNPRCGGSGNTAKQAPWSYCSLTCPPPSATCLSTARYCPAAALLASLSHSVTQSFIHSSLSRQVVSAEMHRQRDLQNPLSVTLLLPPRVQRPLGGEAREGCPPGVSGRSAGREEKELKTNRSAETW